MAPIEREQKQAGSAGASASALEPEWLDAAAQGLLASGAAGKERALDLYKRAIEVHREARDYDKALAAIDGMLKIERQAYALAAKGEILRLVGGGDWSNEALAAVEEAIRLSPADGWTRVVHAETLRSLNRLGEAAEELKRAVEIDPTVADWHYRRGDVLQLLNRFPESLASLNEAIRQDPGRAEAFSQRGNVLRMMGRTKESLEDFDRALQLEPNDARTLARKGDALRELGELSAAAEALQQAIGLRPDGYPFAQTVLGNVLLQQGRERDALTLFEQALEKDRNAPAAIEGKARALLYLDEIEECLSISSELTKFDKYAAYAHGLIGLSLLQTEEYARGIEALERSIKVDGDVAGFRNGLANGCLLQARTDPATETASHLIDKAIAQSDKARKLAPGNVSYHSTFGEALFMRSRRDEAAAEFKKVYESASGGESLDYYAATEGGWAAYRLAVLEPAGDHLSTPFLPEAERLFVEALSMKSERTAGSGALSVRFNLALVMLCSGRFSLAFREFKNASELAVANNLQPRLCRGLLGRAKADLTEAIGLWPQLRQSPDAEQALQYLAGQYSDWVGRIRDS